MKKLVVLALLVFSFFAVSSVQAGEKLRAECTAFVIGEQHCNTAIPYSFKVTEEANYRVRLTAPRTHCSSVIYSIFAGNERIGNTIPLKPGQSDSMSLGKLRGGEYAIHSILIKAIGVRGGCNKGHVYSWEVIPNVFKSN